MFSFAHGMRMQWGFTGLSILVALVAAVNQVSADTVYVAAVEEDWELVVTTPDASLDAPQVTCVFSPLCTTGSVHAALDINHQSLPTYVPGGIQLQVWDGELPVSERKFPSPNVMSGEGEQVRWTTRMQVAEGLLQFAVVNGTSSTWGTFGGQGYLQETVEAPVANLNAYNPAVSVQNSGIGYAGNRVQSLVLKRVRYYLSDGQAYVDETPRVVYPKN